MLPASSARFAPRRSTAWRAPAGRDLRDAARIAARLRRLYATASLPEAALLHPVAVHRGLDGRLRVLAIGPSSPRSRTDAFVLGLARARADLILTTGRILRAEPGLEATPPVPATLARELRAWRRVVAGREADPVFAVLTSGRDLPLDHRLLHGRAPVLLLVPPAGAKAAAATAAASGQRLRFHRATPADLALLRRRLAESRPRAAGRAARGARPIDVLVLPRLDPARALAVLRHGLRVRTISLEAGPATAGELRAAGALPDELWLSIHEGPLQRSVELAGDLPGERELHRIFGPPVSCRIRREGGGRWTFLRFRLS